MSEPGQRVASWLHMVSELLGEHLNEFPHQLVLEQLAETFDVTGVGHSSANASGHQQMISYPRGLLDPVVEIDEWLSGRSQEHHPLMRWHATTGDLRPTTINRVPTALVPARDRLPLLSILRTYELDQQIAIGYRQSGAAHKAYVLGRAGVDFTDDDLVVARYVQRAIVGLDRQVSLLRRLDGLQDCAFDVGLTGRETSVLALLIAGYSNRVIARRLDCAPRTVEKHLERIFRKLCVRDKLNAVRVAQAWGLAASLGRTDRPM